MSLKLNPAAARLTVLGSGWNNSSINSGEGLTEDGKLLEDIAKDLGYDYGENVDWDSMAGDQNWSDSIVEDNYGNVFFPAYMLDDIEIALGKTAEDDKNLLQYDIMPHEIKDLYRGPVVMEVAWDNSDKTRPHRFTPPVFYIQKSATEAYLFQKEVFFHTDASGGNLSVEDTAISIRGEEGRKVYWSLCNTKFSDINLPDKYQSFPIEYICWQCLWGSFGESVITSADNVKKAEDIYEKVEIDGEEYYRINGG